ncbi:MAG TPA: nucleotidyltransferase family protein [Elusimicrobiota bacterium]|nr:nucleotidyltransferase family protein [Elusimicrobiota bacterium]
MEKIKKIVVQSTLNARQTLDKMEAGGGRILFVVDREGSITGVVTDGDIRRWILKGGTLNEPISKVMHRDPTVLREGFSLAEARELMLSRSIDCLPVVDAKRRVVSAIWLKDLFEKKKGSPKKPLGMPVVIMAGGEGNRLAPFTHVLPKPLVPVGGKPIIERIIDRFGEYDCNEFFLTINYKSHLIKAYFHDSGQRSKVNLRYVEESKPLGTAGSLGLLKTKIKSTFWVSNCDILIEADFADIVQFHRNHSNGITLVGSMKHYTIPYGVCRLDARGDLKNIDEKPEYDFLVNTGVYVLEPEVLRLIPPDRKFHFTELIDVCLKKGQKIGVYPISEKSWMDMGQLEELKAMSLRF